MLAAVLVAVLELALRADEEADGERGAEAGEEGERVVGHDVRGRWYANVTPNPFAARTVMPFALGAEARVSLAPWAADATATRQRLRAPPPEAPPGRAAR